MKKLIKRWKNPTTKTGKVLRGIGGVVTGLAAAKLGIDLPGVTDTSDDTAIYLEFATAFIGLVTLLIGQLQEKKETKASDTL